VVEVNNMKKELQELKEQVRKLEATVAELTKQLLMAGGTHYHYYQLPITNPTPVNPWPYSPWIGPTCGSIGSSTQAISVSRFNTIV